MSTPTRIPTTVPARRALLVGVALALFSLVAAPAGASASAPAETTASLRAKRQVLVARIASLTDEADRAQATVVGAQRAQAMTQAALTVVRTRFARHAVDAYLHGVQRSEDERLRRKAWEATLSSSDERLLRELRRATSAAESDELAAAKAIAESTRVRAELVAARATLEKTIADRTKWERAARTGSSARRVAMTSSGSARHRRATGSQSELMQRYRFGPGGVPDGLVRSGEVLEGRASWYGPGFDGRTTASGAIFDQEGWTVAHKTLPLGTILLVTHGSRSVVVLVNDRGPYVAGRILDLSHGVAAALGTVSAGVASVRAEVLVPAS